MDLDPDDPRPPYIQVAGSLRAAILTRKYAPGDKLPSGSELARTFGVARMTIQNALALLREEGLIVSRQGSGVFVRERTERPIGLRPDIERLFEQERVTIDFAGFSGETLAGALQEPLDKVRVGRVAPEVLRIRILVPDPSRPWAVPCRVEDLEDDPEFRQRMDGISSRSTQSIVDSVTELGDLGLIKSVSAEVRAYGAPPLFKLYVLNDEEAFFGFYPVVPHTMSIDGAEHQVYDLMGKDATLFHHVAVEDDTAISTQYVAQARTWFDSVWNTVARPLDAAR